MFERLLAEFLFSAAGVVESHDFSGRPGRCPHCEADAVVGRLGLLTFAVFFVGFLFITLAALPFGLGIGSFAVTAGGTPLEHLAFVGIALAMFAIGVGLARGARRLAHRSRFFRVRCRACGRRWRQSMPPGTVSLSGTTKLAEVLLVLLCVGVIGYVIVTGESPVSTD